MNLYRQESSNPKWNAQRNLNGRTHYVDDDILRFHKARILSTHISDNGLLFAIVESVATVMDGSKRGYRYAIFDLFGNCIERPDLDHCYRNGEQARKAMWSMLATLDAKGLTLGAINRQDQAHRKEMDEMRAKLRELA